MRKYILGGLATLILSLIPLDTRIESTEYSLKKVNEIKYTLPTEKIDTCYYTIKQGDKGYWDISERILHNEKAWKEIQKMNPRLKSEDLKVGQTIKIPCKIED